MTEGYVSVEGIAKESEENLEKIEGFDSELSSEILSRATNYIKEKNAEDLEIINKKINDEELKNLPGITNKILALLATNDICTLDDFAGLATYDLIDKHEGILKDLDLDEKIVNEMIMKARENWFEEEVQS